MKSELPVRLGPAAMKVFERVLIFVPLLALVYYLEVKLRDHQWAFAAVEDKLVTFSTSQSEPQSIPAGTWAHISGALYHSEVTDSDFGVLGTRTPKSATDLFGVPGD